MPSIRINGRLSPPLAEYVASMVGESGLYETPSDYIRDLIRHDMEQRRSRSISEAIRSGYSDWTAGAVLASSGNSQRDMQPLQQKEARGWA